MATSNQIAWKQAQEQERSNKAKEHETKRSNKAKEQMDKLKFVKDSVTSLGSGIMSAAGKVLNDPQWYAEDPQLVKDTASLSFNNPIGNGYETQLGTHYAPGVMVLPFIPTIGRTTNDNGRPIADITAKNIYAYVRHANSGSRNYEAVDLMLYLLAMDNAYSYWAWMRRLYSLLLTAKSRNRYYNTAMVEAAGGLYTNLISQIADLRAYINTFAIRLNSFYVPTGINYITRHQWMNSHIFKDSENHKCQEYMFVQKYFLRYDWTNGTLKTDFDDEFDNFSGTTTNDLESIRGFGNSILSKLMDSEDIGIISGDILKAYGESNMFYVPSTPEDYHIESTYSLEVLSQIHNADTHLVEKTAINIFQVNGQLVQGKAYYETDNLTNDVSIKGYGIIVNDAGPDGDKDAYPHNARKLFDIYKDNPTPDDIMVASRLITTSQANFINNRDTEPTARLRRIIVTSVGSEILDTMYVYTYQKNTYGQPILMKIAFADWNAAYPVINMSDPTGSLPQITTLEKFHYHPAVFITAADDLSDYSKVNMLFNLQNYTSINRQVIDNMHYTAMLSLFGVPKLGLNVRTR